MEFPSINKTVNKITLIQKKLGKYMLRQKELQKRNPEYQLPKKFYQLRNWYESIRIKKAFLIREKNKHLSFMAFN